MVAGSNGSAGFMNNGDNTAGALNTSDNSSASAMPAPARHRTRVSSTTENPCRAYCTRATLPQASTTFGTQVSGLFNNANQTAGWFHF